MDKYNFIWNQTNLRWNEAMSTWSDFQEAAQVIKSGGNDEFYEWQQRQAEERRKRMVRVVCQVKGIRYSEEHYRKNSTILVEDVRLVLKELGMDVFIDDVEVNL